VSAPVDFVSTSTISLELNVGYKKISSKHNYYVLAPIRIVLVKTGISQKNVSVILLIKQDFAKLQFISLFLRNFCQEKIVILVICSSCSVLAEYSDQRKSSKQSPFLMKVTRITCVALLKKHGTNAPQMLIPCKYSWTVYLTYAKIKYCSQPNSIDSW
jgi:hypothetical protein